ncbi:MAG: hypothetical protein NC177_09890 [Ruminococcus flavefaciens]|nr:hypothetical protein [Ruminococcus flavefaciens]
MLIKKITENNCYGNIYILNSLISDTKKELTLGLLVMSVDFLILVNICYNMGRALIQR